MPEPMQCKLRSLIHHNTATIPGPYAKKCPSKTNAIAINIPLETPAACPAFDAFVVELEALADPVMVEVPELPLVTGPTSAEVVVAGTEVVAMFEVAV